MPNASRAVDARSWDDATGAHPGVVVVPHAGRSDHSSLINFAESGRVGSTPNGIRTRATALKGRRPRPLDDEGLRGESSGGLRAVRRHRPQSSWGSSESGSSTSSYVGLASAR